MSTRMIACLTLLSALCVLGCASETRQNEADPHGDTDVPGLDEGITVSPDAALPFAYAQQFRSGFEAEVMHRAGMGENCVDDLTGSDLSVPRPNDWVEEWDEQREAGTFPGRY